MTSDPPRDTPPPAPRRTLRDPPPAPRKHRRGVRKSRRRPRADPTHPPPVCSVCHRRRPLRASGLCWSLACALQSAHDDHDDHAEHAQSPQPMLHDDHSHSPQHAPPSHDEPQFLPVEEPLPQVDSRDAVMTSPRIRSEDAASLGHAAPEGAEQALRHACDEAAGDVREIQVSQGSDDIEADDGTDRGRLVEDIQRQDKDVDRSDSEGREDGAS